MKSWLDTALGRLTMYRLVLFALILLAVAAFVVAATGGISYSIDGMAASLIVLLIATYLTNRLFARLFGVRPHSESSLITALLMFFILQPSTEPLVLLQVALAALAATGSKYVLAFRGRHIFNPAAFGAFWLMLFHFYLALWWVGNPVLAPLTAVLALVILYRTRRLPLAAVFIAVVLIIALVRMTVDGAELSATLRYVFAQTPVLFFAGFMLTEPLTLPPVRWQQLAEALLVGVVFALPITIGGFTSGPESALLVGNIAAFMVGQRRGITLTLRSRRALNNRSTEYEFSAHRPVRFNAGQYLEVTVPHRSADSRGMRRVFSIASPPTEPDLLRISMRTPARGSTFKKALGELEIGSVIQATSVGGDFLLPRNRSVPVLMIAGGIGITPFISQLADLEQGRDIVIVHVISGPADVLYADVLRRSSARVVLVSNTAVETDPDFETYQAAELDARTLAAIVPDVARRRVYVSGSPRLVDAVVVAADAVGAKRIRKDYFNGY